MGAERGITAQQKETRVKTAFGELFFFSFQFPFLPKTFSGSVLLLPLLPASPAASRGNGRLLGKRSKRRNCLGVHSSKRASSIWRDRVRWARRPLPCPPAAAVVPASCRGDREPRAAGVSCRARTRTFTLKDTRAQPAAATRARTRLPPRPATPRSRPLCCSRRGRSPDPCVRVSLCGLRVRAARCAWLSAWPPRWPVAPGSFFPGAAAPEVSHVAGVCFLFAESCVYLLGGQEAAAGRTKPRQRRRVTGGDAPVAQRV